MAVRTPALIGREEELGRLVRTVDGSGPRYAVLTSDPGMGKTMVIEALLAEAVRHPVTVLRAAPAEADESLGFAALSDLLEPVEPSRFDGLPPPQRSAIRAALLLEEPEGEIDPRAVAAALRGLLGGLAEERPVAIVVDDAHWLDGGTAQALGHVLRRSSELPVRVVAACRPAGRPVDQWLPGGFEARDDIALAALTPSELGIVIRRALHVSLDRETLRDIATVSEGNPLFALELARSRRTAPDARSRPLDGLLAERIGVLPRATRLCLLVVALAAKPTLEVVSAARGIDVAEVLELLEPAVSDGLVSVTERVRFRHPLFISAVISRAPDADIRGMHARLAGAEVGEEVRVRHRGLAATGRDAELASELEVAARAARARGAWESSTQLMQMAVERSPAEDDISNRAQMLGTWLARSGRSEEAETWLQQACHLRLS